MSALLDHKKLRKEMKEKDLKQEEFAEKLLAEEKVAVVPGTAFGECGEGFIRISYAYSLDNLKTALERVQRFIEKLKKGEINKTK